MLLGSYPRLLVLALSLPEVSHALGLGNLRVDSRLNEPLSAQIDIIGATPDELKAIKASVASPELFERYNAERPAFLSSATITVGTDAAGKPVLNIQSSDAFTEPLVEFLIDLHWGKGELVRDYSLLLDPARVTPALSANTAASSNDVPSAPVDASLAEIPKIVLTSTELISLAPPKLVLAADPVAVNTEMQYRVVAHDTLRNIARNAGARSEAELQRMMLAIFQANQEAFAGNINRLHSGALIKIPSPAEIQSFDSADVEREIRAQMTAWRRGGRPASRGAIALPALAHSEPAAVRAPAPETTDVSAVVSTVNSLDDRVQFLQQTLAETNRQLAIATARLSTMERAASPAPPPAIKAVAGQAKSPTGRVSVSAVLMAFAVLAGGLAYAYRRLLSRRSLSRKPARTEEPPTIEVPVAANSLGVASSAVDATEAYTVNESVLATALYRTLVAPETTAAPEATMETTQVVDIDVDTVEQHAPEGADEPDTVVLETLEPKAIDAVGTVLDYNLSDLDGRAQHLEMPDSLHDQVVLVERRKNVVDTLMAAIERDPTRYDLRMKLLETLYNAASTNLRAFKEVVRDLASHPERLEAGEWDQIMMMGRQIAADDALFTDQATDHKVADCA